jgi:hypothetical protein
LRERPVDWESFPVISGLEEKEGQQMVIRKSLIGLAATGLVLGSTAAAAAPVASEARTASSVSESEGLAGVGTFGLLLAVLIVAGALAIILSDDDDDVAVSP